MARPTSYAATVHGTTYHVTIPDPDTAYCARCRRTRSTLLMVLTLGEGWVCQPRCQ